MRVQFHKGSARLATKHPALQGLRALARGHFCRVYDNGDTVLKLTADPLSYAIYTDGHRPQGEHFPVLVRDHGEAGAWINPSTKKSYPLYLVEMEKLQPISRGPAAIRKLARELCRHISSASTQARSSLDLGWGWGTTPETSHRIAVEALRLASEDEALPASIREALEQLSSFIANFKGATLDWHSKNLMRRGDTLVLNDVIADYEQL